MMSIWKREHLESDCVNVIPTNLKSAPILLIAALLLDPLAILQAADDPEAIGDLLKPPEFWKDFDPKQGDFKK